MQHTSSIFGMCICACEICFCGAITVTCTYRAPLTAVSKKVLQRSVLYLFLFIFIPLVSHIFLVTSSWLQQLAAAQGKHCIFLKHELQWFSLLLQKRGINNSWLFIISWVYIFLPWCLAQLQNLKILDSGKKTFPIEKGGISSNINAGRRCPGTKIHFPFTP